MRGIVGLLGMVIGKTFTEIEELPTFRSVEEVGEVSNPAMSIRSVAPLETHDADEGASTSKNLLALFDEPAGVESVWGIG